METEEPRKLIPLRSISHANGGPIHISLPMLYKLSKEGKWPTIRIGRSILISSEFVDKLIATGKGI